jgi:hypothetical protein
MRLHFFGAVAGQAVKCLIKCSQVSSGLSPPPLNRSAAPQGEGLPQPRRPPTLRTCGRRHPHFAAVVVPALTVALATRTPLLALTPARSALDHKPRTSKQPSRCRPAAQSSSARPTSIWGCYRLRIRQRRRRHTRAMRINCWKRCHPCRGVHGEWPILSAFWNSPCTRLIARSDGAASSAPINPSPRP